MEAAYSYGTEYQYDDVYRYMAARVTPWPHEGQRPELSVIEKILKAENMSGYIWTNKAGTTYAWRHRDHFKVLYCLAGSITVHTPEGDLILGPGDRLDLDPGTSHAITVGPSGASCIEARP